MLSEKAVRYILVAYEKKLKELMSSCGFDEFIKSVSKEAFRIEINDAKDSEFKKFVLENFEEITK